jgi:hypothetical protein
MASSIRRTRKLNSGIVYATRSKDELG